MFLFGRLARRVQAVPMVRTVIPFTCYRATNLRFFRTPSSELTAQQQAEADPQHVLEQRTNDSLPADENEEVAGEAANQTIIRKRHSRNSCLHRQRKPQQTNQLSPFYFRPISSGTTNANFVYNSSSQKMFGAMSPAYPTPGAPPVFSDPAVVIFPA